MNTQVKFTILLSLWAITISGSISERTALGEDFLRILDRSKWHNAEISSPQLETLKDDIELLERLCSPDELFMDMHPSHMQALSVITKLLRGKKESPEMLEFAELLRDDVRINKSLWLRAILTVAQERKDLVALPKPNPLALTPENFLTKDSYEFAVRQGKLPPHSRVCVPVDGSLTSTDNGIETVLWYFREDLLVNFQHLFWHLSFPSYPVERNTTYDRKGELFYYFHHELLARYNAERLSKNLPRGKPFPFEEGATIEEGYFHHLSEMRVSTQWGNRDFNTTFVNATQWTELADLVYSDINAGELISTNGTKISLMSTKGIELLGDCVEADQDTTVNPERYDKYGVHAEGHQTIAFHVDSGLGLLMSVALSLRDPIFYRWHFYLEEMFRRHKEMLTPYTPTVVRNRSILSLGDLQLSWPGVSVTNVKVLRESSATTDEFHTSFSNSTVSLPVTPEAEIVDGFIDYCIKRLGHEPFEYEISIEREPSVLTKEATVRIFMAPRFDENGERFSMNEQRTLFFAMDRFQVNLDAGMNVITRKSSESSLSMQWNFEDPESGPPSEELPTCGCGWPQHMLIPAGRVGEGMAFDLFVMVTDGLIDTPEESQPEDPVCTSSHILCGGWGRKYPDTRPMGYPFDREPYSIYFPDGDSRMVADLDEYTQFVQNTKAIQVKIIHDE